MTTSTDRLQDVPLREDVPAEHRWSLHKLYDNETAWERDFAAFERRMNEITACRGTLGQSAERLAACCETLHALDHLAERLGYYAHLRVAEDIARSESQGRMARYLSAATRFSALCAFITPEIQAIPDDRINAWLETDVVAPWRIHLRKILRYKPHVLSEAEERLLAMQSEFSQTARRGFDALTDADMHFGHIDTPDGRRPLTHATYASFMQNPDRELRRRAYEQYLAEYEAHKNTLAALYNGNVQLDVYGAKVRHFRSALEKSLFADDVPATVYETLIASVHDALPALHRYYDLRKRVLNLDRLRLYDTRVPIVPDVKTHHTYEQAVDLIIDSLAPLGDAYTRILRDGLRGHWVDRYENKGKRSGAFSAGSYTGDPYILMNYRDDDLSSVFTLTHEAGHSMHAWYSAEHQPYQDYQCTIFVAEVASTFNEQLLARHLMRKSDNPKLKAYLLNKQIDDLLATLFRQTMFAEYEKITHEMAERNEPLTVDSLRAAYRGLLERYFGPAVALEAASDLEGLRIPHFYAAFYVYKYATGLSAAIALSERVLNGGAQELNAYLDFLKSGGSRFPLEQLRDAGVDMASPEPVRAALANFDRLVAELERVL